MRAFVAFLTVLFFLAFSCQRKKEIEYYPNGEIKYQVGLDKNGLRTGLYEEYFDNGVLKSTWEYQDGIEEGEYKEFSPKGFLQVYGVMKQGDFVKSEGYDSLGKIFERRLYMEGKIYYVEKFDWRGSKRLQQALPILPSKTDTVFVGEEYCLPIKLGIKFQGKLTLTVGHLVDGEAQDIDTINFTSQSFKYCVKSKIIGQNQIRGYFEQSQSEMDTVTINEVAFEQVFYVKEDPNQKGT